MEGTRMPAQTLLGYLNDGYTLEEFLDNFPGCLVIVSHDRYFMDRLVDHLFVFEGKGSIRDFPGNYTDFREWEKNSKDNSKPETAIKKPDPIKVEE
jgi:ABC transport system ATP-binding/permease protein